MPGLVLHKRWRLREGVAVTDVVQLVRGRIVPHYARLSPEVALGLEQDAPGSVVATQRWTSRAALVAATTGAAYDAWWEAYLPVLSDWDRLVTFDSEWESVALL